MSSALDRLTDALGARVVKRGRHSAMAKCPAHDDGTASLSLSVNAAGDVLLKCHAGCTAEQIVGALAGFTMPMLFADYGNGTGNGATPAREIIATYDYTDADGQLLYQVVRYWPKDFRQRRPDGNGGWLWSLGETPRVLYRLPAIIEAVAMGRTIYITEGEKDADALVALGLDATTNAGGAEKWRPEYTATLKDAVRVVIIPDNDAAGRAHAAAVSYALAVHAGEILTLTLPNLPEKGDVSDWLAAGGTVEGLAPPPEPKRRYRLYTDLELDALPTPPHQIANYCTVGSLVALVGKYASFKSFVLLDQACCIGTGAEWQGRRVQHGPVVYIYAEGAWGIRQRVRAWKAAYRYEGSVGVYFLPTACLLTDPAQVTLLLAEITRTGIAPRAVFVDTVARNMAGDESKVADMGLFIRGCDTLRETLGATVHLAHHMGWNADRSRGSTNLPGSVDTEVLLERDDMLLTLKNTKQKDGPEFADFTLQAVPTAESLTLRTFGRLTTDLTKNEHIILTLVQQSEPMTAKAIMEETNIAHGSAYNAISRLVSLSYVKRRGTKIAITDVGKLLAPSNSPTPSK